MDKDNNMESLYENVNRFLTELTGHESVEDEIQYLCMLAKKYGDEIFKMRRALQKNPDFIHSSDFQMASEALNNIARRLWNFSKTN